MCDFFLQRDRKREREGENEKMMEREEERARFKASCKVTGTEGKKTSYLERRRQSDSLKSLTEREIDREKHCVDKKTLKGTIQR